MKFAPEEIELALGAFQKIDNEAAWKAVGRGRDSRLKENTPLETCKSDVKVGSFGLPRV